MVSALALATILWSHPRELFLLVSSIPPSDNSTAEHDRASQPHQPPPIASSGDSLAPLSSGHSPSLALRGLHASRTSHRTWKMHFMCLGRPTAHKFDYEICWLNQFCGLLPKAASRLCLIGFCQPHPRLCCCQGSVYSHCQGCYPTCKHCLPGMENHLLPEVVWSTLHAACFCLWLGLACQTLDPSPPLSLLSVSHLFFSC